ncbi:MAG: hypothetical protein AAF222_00685 [Pseudomonadota bacterium]
MRVGCRPFSLALIAVMLSGSMACADDDLARGPEFAREAEALVNATAAFFDAVEGVDRIQKRRPVIRTLRPTGTTIDSGATKTGILTQNGPVDHLTGYRVTWYPLDHLSGTVDFMGTWNGNRNLVCGYLTWDMSDPAAPVLDRVAANFVDLSALKGAPTYSVHASLLEANCAFGAIDANFHQFNIPG